MFSLSRALSACSYSACSHFDLHYLLHDLRRRDSLNWIAAVMLMMRLWKNHLLGDARRPTRRSPVCLPWSKHLLILRRIRFEGVEVKDHYPDSPPEEESIIERPFSRGR